MSRPVRWNEVREVSDRSVMVAGRDHAIPYLLSHRPKVGDWVVIDPVAGGVVLVRSAAPELSRRERAIVERFEDVEGMTFGVRLVLVAAGLGVLAIVVVVGSLVWAVIAR